MLPQLHTRLGYDLQVEQHSEFLGILHGTVIVCPDDVPLMPASDMNAMVLILGAT